MLAQFTGSAIILAFVWATTVIAVPNPTTLQALPPELLQSVTGYLDCNGAAQFSQTCRSIHKVVNDAGHTRLLKNRTALASRMESYLQNRGQRNQRPLKRLRRTPSDSAEAATTMTTERPDGIDREASALLDEVIVLVLPFVRALFYQHWILRPLARYQITPRGNHQAMSTPALAGYIPITEPIDYNHIGAAIVPDGDVSVYQYYISEVLGEDPIADTDTAREEPDEPISTWIAGEVRAFRPELDRIQAATSRLILSETIDGPKLALQDPVAHAAAVGHIPFLVQLVRLSNDPDFQIALQQAVLQNIPVSHIQFAAVLASPPLGRRTETMPNRRQQAQTSQLATVLDLLTRSLPQSIYTSTVLALAAQGRPGPLLRFTSPRSDYPDGVLSINPETDLPPACLSLVVAADYGHLSIFEDQGPHRVDSHQLVTAYRYATHMGMRRAAEVLKAFIPASEMNSGQIWFSPPPARYLNFYSNDAQVFAFHYAP
ncbi:hypothetical protein IWQ60_007570 [Tieghemiomyces parasiticus]|uniref:F-box domain-containing protein n=1 Tax=Tieghemiomyces parasiticus TaxID=78921 RepID=A0A9W7ZWP2_9FUNG|nr:hypothetical protein IWQ60_007570 [Tieghemiomyces parasiticus]